MNNLIIEEASLRASARIISEAREWIGTPYQHQASCCGVGTDCLGLVRGIYRKLYGDEPQVPAYAAYAAPNEDEILLTAAQTYLHEVPLPAKLGQVMIFRMRRSLPPRHLAIMSFENKMIHAASGLRVAEINFSDWWQRRVVAAFAFPLPLPENPKTKTSSNG